MREKIGLAMLIIGGLLWPIGLSLGYDPFPDILIPHLLFVIPGVYLKGSRILGKLSKKGN